MRSQILAWLAASCSILLSSVSAVPSLNFPISSQVPPVALKAQQYSFTFAQSTFIVPLQPVSYSLLNEPSWLRFDNETRTFFGNVTAEDAGPVTFDLIASDSSGSASLEVTFFVADESGPRPGIPLLPQLAQSGPVSAPASLLLHPLEPFSTSLSPETFCNTTGETKFYATTADNSPLPSWLEFNASTFAFAGLSPPLISPTAKPQDYSVRLTASDVAGFAQAEANFDIIVSYHVLAFSKSSQDLEIFPGLGFESKPLRQNLDLDGNLIDDPKLASVISDAPDWAELDTEQILLQGSAPRDVLGRSILIQATDIYGNIANTSINLLVSSSQGRLFNSTLSPVKASIGHDFRYSLAASTFSSNDVQVTADLTNASSWMTYDAISRTLSGRVPDVVEPGPIVVTLNATRGSLNEQQRLLVHITRSSTSAQTPSDSLLPASSTSLTHSRPTSGPSRMTRDKKRELAIVLGVTIPLGFLIGLIGLTCYCCLRRQRRRTPSDQGSDADPSKCGTRCETKRANIAGLKEEISLQEAEAPVSPPRIDLPWAPDSLRMSREKLSKAATNCDSAGADTDWGDFVIHETPESVRFSQGISRRDSDILEGLRQAGDWTPFVRVSSNNVRTSRRRTPLRNSQAKMRKLSTSSHASKSLSTLSTLSTGLPGRLSGAGHGAGGPGPPQTGAGWRSWRNAADSLPSCDGKITPVDLSNFPEPPTGQPETKDRLCEPTTKSSVRLVSSSSSHSGSLADQRQRWVRARARDRHGQGSNMSHTRLARDRPYMRDIESSVTSPSRIKSRPFNHGGLSKQRSTPHPWSQSSDMGARTKLDYGITGQSPDLYLARPPSTLRRALSTVSSRQLNSMESKSNSSWVDDLIEEEDEQGHRRWVALDKPSQQSSVISNSKSPGEQGSEQGSWGKNSKAGGLGALRDNIQGGAQGTTMGERRWKLGSEQAKRPISVDEGELQRSLGSQRGNLAFM